MRVNQSSSKIHGGEGSSAKGPERASTTREAKGTERTKGGPPAERIVDRDAVNTEISQKSRDFAQAKAIAGKTPDVRENRVAELKKQINDGTYKVNTDAVADRMVDEHLKMSFN